MFLFGLLFLCELLLISVSDAQNYDIAQNNSIGVWILGPEITSLIPLDGSGFFITFNGVRSSNVDDPVIGYKIFIKKLSTNITAIPDEFQPRQEKLKNKEGFFRFAGPKVDLSHLFTAYCKGSPSMINVPAVFREFVYRIRVLGLKPNVHYGFAIRAFTKSLIGPLSIPAIGYMDGRRREPGTALATRQSNKP